MSSGDKELLGELDVLVRARYPLIYLVSWEEDRITLLLSQVAAEGEKRLQLWSTTEGMVDVHGKVIDGEVVDPFQALNYIIDYTRPALFVLKDFHAFMDDPVIIRRLRDLKKYCVQGRKTCFILSPVLKVPDELEKLVTVVEVDLPNSTLVGSILDSIIAPLKSNTKVNVTLSESERELVIKSALGLTMDEAENVFAKSLVQSRKLDPDVIIKEKEQIIKKGEILEYFHPQEGLDAIGGLYYLKDWLKKRQKGFTERAQEYGLPFPKGVMLIGIQGCGKSLTAKAIASLWKLPLLRLDVGKLFGSLVGESEHNIRKAIKLAESVSPAILWIDEIEKGFSGVSSSGSTDSGTTSRVFGSFITWLQEKEEPVFVIATANNVSLLPPEILRKGRFDEIFFVDLPSEVERQDIFRIHLEKRGRKVDDYLIDKLVEFSQGFSGAEVEQAIISAMFESFNLGREVTSDDIIQALEETVPLSRLMKDSINDLRTWAQSRARPASNVEVSPGQQLDLEL